jgi:hypothetical protein
VPEPLDRRQRRGDSECFGVARGDFEFQMLPDPHLRPLRHPVVSVPDATDGQAAGHLLFFLRSLING